MRITHLCLACFFPDGFSYQENMLPKYHKKLGHDVSVVASLQTFDKNGNVIKRFEPTAKMSDVEAELLKLL